MKQSFVHYLQQQNLPRDEIASLCQLSEVIELPARTALVRQSERAERFYFVVKGLCHACYYTAEGKQYSKEFYWKAGFMIGFEALIGQQPSPYLLETLSPSLLVSLPMSIIRTWRDDRHPLYVTLLENQLINKEMKERIMLLNSPEKRYQLFCQSFPELEVKLADYQIAAYLGITPISLSRIKKRLNINNG